MMLGARQMERVREFECRLRANVGGSNVDLFRQVEPNEAPESALKVALQSKIMGFEGQHEAFSNHERGDRELCRGRVPHGPIDARQPNRVLLHEINDETGVEINQSQAARCSAMNASISSALRRELSGSGFSSSHLRMLAPVPI